MEREGEPVDEAADFLGGDARLGIDGVEWQWRDNAPVGQHASEAGLPDVGGDQPNRGGAGAEALQQRLVDRLRAVGRDAARELDVPGVGAARQTQLVDANRAVEDEPRQAFELSRGARFAVSLPEGGARDKDALHVAELAHTVGGFLKRADANGDVEAFFDDVARPVIEDELDAELGVAGEEFAKAGHNPGSAEGDGGKDAEFAAEGARATTDGFIGFFDGLEDGAAAVEVFATLVGEVELARGAVEEAGAEAGFELLDGACDVGLGDAQIAGGGGKAASLGRADEGDHGLVEVHWIDTEFV